MVTFHHNPEENEITAAFNGRLDTLAVQTLNEIIRINLPVKEGPSGEKIIFDMKEVDYISSSFIRICVGNAKKAGAGRFSIANCQPFVKKTFKISGLDDVLNIR